MVKETFRRQFYFDLAGTPFPDQVHGLLRFVGSTRLLYGSDFPFTPGPVVGTMVEKMEEESKKIWTAQEVSGILRTNAEKMLGG